MMLKTYCFHHKTEEEEHKQKRQQTEVTTSSQHLDHNNMDPHCLVRLNWKITNDLVVIREGLQSRQNSSFQQKDEEQEAVSRMVVPNFIIAQLSIEVGIWNIRNMTRSRRTLSTCYTVRPAGSFAPFERGCLPTIATELEI